MDKIEYTLAVGCELYKLTYEWPGTAAAEVIQRAWTAGRTPREAAFEVMEYYES